MPMFVIRTWYRKATIGGPQQKVTVGITVCRFPVSPPSPGMPEYGLSQRSSWSQRSLVVSPSRITSLSLITGGLTLAGMAPVAPAGDGEVDVMDDRFITWAVRLKSILSGLKSNGTMPMFGGSMQVMNAGILPPTRSATEFSAEFAALPAAFSAAPADWIADPRLIVRSHPPVHTQPAVRTRPSARSPEGRSQEPLVHQHQDLHRDAEG